MRFASPLLRFALTGAALGASLHGSNAHAEPPAPAPTPESKVELTLTAALKLADDRAPQIKMAKDRVLAAHAQLDEIKWIPWTQFSMTGGVAYVPEIKGNAVYSPYGDVSLNTSGSAAVRVNIDGVVPLWTFGKISSSQDAAKAQVEVAMADVQRAQNLVRHDVRRAYFGLQMAHDAKYLLDLAKGQLTSAIKRAEANPDMDDGDLLRMKTYAMEIEARYGEVDKGDRMATAALRFFTGIDYPKPIVLPEEPITPPKKALSDVLVYLQSARLHRPELKQVKYGIKAREAQVEYAKAKLFPDIGIGLSVGYARAPSITDQTNAFVYDGGNYLRYGAGIVFRWNLDLLPGTARVAYAKAQLAEVQDTEAYALGGVGVEVENAFALCKDAEKRHQAYGEAEKLAKKWVSGVAAGISVGTREEKDLVDPLRAFLTNRYNHLQAIMDLDVSTSLLILATGDETVSTF